MIAIYALLPHLMRGAVGYSDAAFLEVWKLQYQATARNQQAHPLAQNCQSLPSVDMLNDVDRHCLISAPVRKRDRREVARYVCGAICVD